MAISKNFMKSRPSCKVKFQLKPEDINGANSIYLVGDFNDWNNESHPLKKRKDGSFQIEVELALGYDYQFRYRTESDDWFNDIEADAFVPCAFAKTENFLVKV